MLVGGQAKVSFSSFMTFRWIKYAVLTRCSRRKHAEPQRRRAHTVSRNSHKQSVPCVLRSTFSCQSATILVAGLLLYVVFFGVNRLFIVFVCFPDCQEGSAVIFGVTRFNIFHKFQLLAPVNTATLTCMHRCPSGTSHQCYGSCTGCQSFRALWSRGGEARGSYISRLLDWLPRTSLTTVAFCRTLVVAHCGPTPMTCGSCSCREHTTTSTVERPSAGTGLRRPGLTFDSFRQSLKSHLFGDRSACWLLNLGAIQINLSIYLYVTFVGRFYAYAYVYDRLGNSGYRWICCGNGNWSGWRCWKTGRNGWASDSERLVATVKDFLLITCKVPVGLYCQLCLGHQIYSA